MANVLDNAFIHHGHGNGNVYINAGNDYGNDVIVEITAIIMAMAVAMIPAMIVATIAMAVASMAMMVTFCCSRWGSPAGRLPIIFTLLHVQSSSPSGAFAT